jgi:GPH family glycoside/pentoside/hexuronide:cation symporter
MTKNILPLREKISYGFGDTACNIYFQIVIVYLMQFYTDVFGISAAAAGTMFLIVRVFDGFTDPMMGAIADRTNSRWGRYRPYMLWLAVPFAALGILAFVTPDFSDIGKLVYAYITYSLFMALYTAINIPYSALGGVMTASSSERASVQSFRFAGGMLGGAFVVISLPELVELFGDGDEQKGYPLALAVMGLLVIALLWACFAFTEERVVPERGSSQQKTSVNQDIKDISKNGQWVIIASITFFLLTAVAMRGGVTNYYIEYFFDRKSSIGVFNALGMIAGVAGALSVTILKKYACKVSLFKWATIVVIVLHLGFFALTRDQYLIALALSMAANFFHMIVTVLLFSMVPDTVEYGKSVLKTAGNAMAMSFAGHLLALKFGIAVGGAMTGWGLAYAGYEANAVQSQSTLSGIVAIYASGPIVLGVIILGLLSMYKLTNNEMTKYAN